MKIKVRPRLEYKDGREMFDRPEGILECSGVIDGAVRTWKEYVPASYTGATPVPLVVTLHGGSSKKGANNQRAELSTAWALVADREGFIVLYPQSLTPEHTWSAWEDFSDKERTKNLKDDISYLNQLFQLIREKYNIDETRMYLHGQSFGDVMGTYYLLNYPEHEFAAAATMSGPVGAGRLFNPDGSYRFGKECGVPLVRTHGSVDLAIPLGEYARLEDTTPTFDLMREMRKTGCSEMDLVELKMKLHQIPCIENWKHCNGCTELPRLNVRGRYNSCTWPGTYDFHFYMVEKGGHGPSMDMADFIWSSFFTGYKRVGEEIVSVQPEDPFVPDQGAVAVADGAAWAYVDNCLTALDTPVRLLDGVWYVQWNSVAQLYPQLSVVLEDDGQSAVVTGTAGEMQVSANNQTIVWNDHLQHRERTILHEGTLLIPLRQIGELFFGQKLKSGYGIAYLSEREGQITYDFGYLVRQLLRVEPVSSGEELYRREQEILRKNVREA